MASKNVTTKNPGIWELVSRYHSAMSRADVRTLDSVLSENFTLVHITGYVQPKHEWLDVVRSRAFQYHEIDVDHSYLSFIEYDRSATVSGKGIFNATINGIHNLWDLRFQLDLRRQGSTWILYHASYSSA